MPARDARTGDQVAYPNGHMRLVTQARWVAGVVVLSHGQNVTSSMPPETPLRVIRSSRKVDKDAPRVAHTSESEA